MSFPLRAVGGAEGPAPSPGSQPLAAQLFIDHQPWLLQRLYDRLRHRGDAEDLASETFLRVLVQPDLSAIQTPRAFLTTLAKRVVFQFWRRRDLEQAYLDALAHQPAAFAPSPEERALLLEALDGVAAALDALPDKARRAFLMSQLEGLTYAQIGERLGVSASMVRQYMAQGWRACASVHAGRE